MEEKKKTKKLMFLFGAGAEREFKLPSGGEYLKSSLFGDKNTESILKALREVFSKTYYEGEYKYSTKKFDNYSLVLKNCIFNKAIEDENFLPRYKKEVIDILSTSDLKELKKGLNASQKALVSEYIEEKKTVATENAREKSPAVDEFREIMSTDSQKEYELISNSMVKEFFSPNEMGQAVLTGVGSIGGWLDGYFHSIISPTKYGPQKFAVIFNYYWMCYFTIVEPIVKRHMSDEANNQQFVDSITSYLDSAGQLNYEKIVREIGSFTRLLHAINLSGEKKDYYSIIKEKVKKSMYCEDVEVATTNYTIYPTILRKKPIYLNGALNLFEIPEKLEVVDFNRYNSGAPENALYFPFLFGQSMVKPIVHEKQIQAFHLFSKKLRETDILIILGYNVNEDDNHINAFLHSYVESGKKVLFVGEQDPQTGVQEYTKKLRCSRLVDYCQVKYGKNSDVIDSIFAYLTKIK